MSDSENIPANETRPIPPADADPSTVMADMSAPVAQLPGDESLNAVYASESTAPPPTFPETQPSVPSTQLAEQLRMWKLPPDLRVPWGWGDLALFLMFYIGTTLILSILALIGTAAYLHIGMDALQKRMTLVVIVSIAAQALGSFAALLYFWALMRIRRAGGFWNALGWRSLNGASTSAGTIVAYLSGGVAMAIAVSAASLVMKQPESVPFEEFFKARQTVLMMMGFGILVAPLVEETIFRGFLYPVAARSFGVATGVVLTGLLFGGFHALQLWGAWAQVGMLVGVGIILTWVRARSGSVLASYLLHVAYNSTLFVGLFMSTHGLRDLPAGK